MSQFKEYTNPRICKAVDYLYSQVYLVTQCEQLAIDSGNCELAETFARIEGMTRLAVEELRLFDAEMTAPPVPQDQPQLTDEGTPSLPGGV